MVCKISNEFTFPGIILINFLRCKSHFDNFSARLSHQKACVFFTQPLNKCLYLGYFPKVHFKNCPFHYCASVVYGWCTAGIQLPFKNCQFAKNYELGLVFTAAVNSLYQSICIFHKYKTGFLMLELSSQLFFLIQS